MAEPFERESIPLTQLTLVDEALGKGAVGAVYALKNDRRWVYKQYTPETLADPRFDSGALTRAIRWRRGLNHQDREQVSQTLCWPRTTVTRNNEVVGVVLPRIPTRFEVQADDLNALRTLDHLFLHPKRLKPLGLEPLPHVVRAALLYGLARALALMERYGIAHGDVSAANALYAFESGRPSIYLIDCDTVAVNGRAAFSVRGTPYWQDPRVAQQIIDEPDVESDRYALGLAFYRIWNRTPGNISEKSTLTLNPPATTGLAQLLRQALAGTGRRPSAAAWANALGDYLRHQTNGDGPFLADAVERLSRDHQLIGTVHLDVSMPEPTGPPQPREHPGPELPPMGDGRLMCKHCDRPIGKGHRFCDRCGRPAPSLPGVAERHTDERFCSGCRAVLRGHQRFCHRCGKKRRE